VADEKAVCLKYTAQSAAVPDISVSAPALPHYPWYVLVVFRSSI
jgi:hypothetical protein